MYIRRFPYSQAGLGPRQNTVRKSCDTKIACAAAAGHGLTLRTTPQARHKGRVRFLVPFRILVWTDMFSALTQLGEITMLTPLDLATSIDEMPAMTGTLNGVSFNYTYTGFGVNRSMDDANQWDN